MAHLTSSLLDKASNLVHSKLVDVSLPANPCETSFQNQAGFEIFQWRWLELGNVGAFVVLVATLRYLCVKTTTKEHRCVP